MGFSRFVSFILFMLILPLSIANAESLNTEDDESVKQYFHSIAGNWIGKGEVVAGAYKNTRFKCDINGITPDQQLGMNIDGRCRIGIFSQPITANITKENQYYEGKFLGGAQDNGFDIIKGYLNESKFTAFLTRKELDGVIIVDNQKKDEMEIIIGVKFEEQYYKIVSINLAREEQKNKRFILPSR